MREVLRGTRRLRGGDFPNGIRYLQRCRPYGAWGGMALDLAWAFGMAGMGVILLAFERVRVMMKG